MTDGEKLQLLIDRAEIGETVYLYGTGIDTRDWKLFRSIFTDKIDACVTGGAFGDNQLKPFTADAWTEGVRGVITRFAVTEHVLTNHRIRVDVDKALCVSYLVARHFSRDEKGKQSVIDVGGYYDFHLVRTAAGWKINEYTLHVTWEDPAMDPNAVKGLK